MRNSFRLGQVCATQGAIALSDNNPTLLRSLLRRHASGDWGELCDNDKRANDDAVLKAGRILSSYTLNGENIWIITEHDRSVTTILLPKEY
ncbi:type I restriction endonuclease subunit M [Photobacterium leiognathi]|uniref:type I restriction endonuclease subunit M n=1 Tax=Photobacterium leiognathi TaxID=553611 RepID=UPI0029829D42|nr:type I restriction endonuclease subunit M [Photobacterium leiognathi]